MLSSPALMEVNVVQQPSCPEGGQVLLIVNARTRAPAGPGDRPVRDYHANQQILDARVVDLDDVDSSRAASAVALLLGGHAGLVMVALRVLRSTPSLCVVHCDAENTGLPLALLARWSRSRIRVFMVLHRPEARAQRLLARLGAARAAAGMFVFGPAMATRVQAALKVPAGKVHVLPMSVDTDFWRPPDESTSAARPPYICSAGIEFRDYATLVQASQDLGVEVRIAAASAFSRRRSRLHDVKLPPHVHEVACDTAGLRDLYQSAEVVVVPLHDVEFPAGTTTVVEAMAAGRCVVVTRATGQAEVVADRRAVLRDGSGRATAGGLVPLLVAERLLPAGAPETPPAELVGATGLYVAAGDPEDLHRVLRHLLDNPALCQDLGARARQVAVTWFDHRVVAERLKDTLSVR